MMPNAPRTVLIVDNDDATIVALKTRIESWGYRCLASSSGTQAGRLFCAEDVDLVITDLHMPGGDGVALMHQIRASSPVPIVVVTGHRDEFKRLLRSIANVSILRKPLAAADLRAVLRAELDTAQGTPQP